MPPGANPRPLSIKVTYETPKGTQMEIISCTGIRPFNQVVSKIEETLKKKNNPELKLIFLKNEENPDGFDLNSPLPVSFFLGVDDCLEAGVVDYLEAGVVSASNSIKERRSMLNIQHRKQG